MRYIFYVFFVISVVSFGRLIPHPPNFTPVLAMGIFLPYLSKDKLIGVASVFFAMLMTDYMIGFHSFMLWVYLSLTISILISYISFKKFNSFVHLGLMSLVSSLTFFVITNLCVWIFSNMYTKTLDGLVLCFYLAIPFFHNTLFSTIIYTILIANFFFVLNKIILNGRLIKTHN